MPEKIKRRSYDPLEIASKSCSSVGSTLAIQAIRQSATPIQESPLLTAGTVFSLIGTALVIATTARKLLHS